MPSEPTDPLRVAFLGGVPPALGGGGLELQMTRTQAALRARGHEVELVRSLAAGTRFDVLHAFGSEPNVWFYLQHWHDDDTPFVLSPVIVIGPGWQERVLRLGAAVPGALTTARMRRDLLRRADAIVCLTAYEQALVAKLSGGAPAFVIGNGTDVIPAAHLPDPPESLPREPFVLMLGGVSPRKRQREVLNALGGRLPVVVVGDWQGDPGEAADFRADLARNGGIWLGRIDDPAAIQAIQRRALGQVLLSRAETQSLAVLEALAVGLPVVVSDIPGHRELAATHPGIVHIAASPAAAAELLLSLREQPKPPAGAIRTWDDVAAELEAVYGSVATSNQKDPP